MAKRKGGSSSGSGDAQYITTQANLDRKGKTNKKLKRNPQASKFLSAFGKELKEKAEAKAKAEFKTGRRTRLKEQRAKEAAERAAEEAKKAAENRSEYKTKRGKSYGNKKEKSTFHKNS